MAVLNADRHATRLDRKGRSLPLCGWLFCVFLLWPPLAHPQVSKEYDIKAVLLFNFVRFVEWPPSAFSSPDAPLVIGVLGADPFGRALDEVVAGEKVNGHPVRVERFLTPRALKPCHILFIASSERGRMREILARLKGTPTLTVGETEGFIEAGGIVRFHRNAEQKIRLQINLEAAKAEGLTISSKLLRVAQVEHGS